MLTIGSPLNISETVRDRCLVLKDDQSEMACGESNGHMADEWRYVTLKGRVVTPIRLKPNISKTVGDAI